jgi:ATP-dependent protease ClpP protease subunit
VAAPRVAIPGRYREGHPSSSGRRAEDMRRGRYLDAHAAVEYGLIDTVTE